MMLPRRAKDGPGPPDDEVSGERAQLAMGRALLSA